MKPPNTCVIALMSINIGFGFQMMYGSIDLTIQYNFPQKSNELWLKSKELIRLLNKLKVSNWNNDRRYDYKQSLLSIMRIKQGLSHSESELILWTRQWPSVTVGSQTVQQSRSHRSVKLIYSDAPKTLWCQAKRVASLDSQSLDLFAMTINSERSKPVSQPL